MAGASLIPRLCGSFTFAGQTSLHFPQAVQRSFTYAGACRMVTFPLSAALISPCVSTRTRGLRSRRRVLISIPHEGGQSFGK